MTLYGPTLYGSTPYSSFNSEGVVFELQQRKQGWIETIQYYFCFFENCRDGANPSGRLILDDAGNLYGTTQNGGANGKGTIFKLTPSKQGWNGSETVLYNFCSLPNCADGSYPQSGLVRDKIGNFYGTTCNRPLTGFYLPGQAPPISGTVFQLTPQGSLNVLASLPGCSLAPLILVDDTFYGTISTGGVYDAGAIFAVSMQPLTTTDLVSSLNPSTYGQSVTWTATVTASGSATPSGKVTFVWEGNPIGVATLSASGIATLSKSNLNADVYPLTALYSGDSNNSRSTSPILNQAIKQTTSEATLRVHRQTHPPKVRQSHSPPPSPRRQSQRWAP